ncbi:hypothetical protein TgHK011_007472 [Trichoderma gracile]|nr:hypothetical protein TgHK011_007472 [Trichoderma gracile]
MALFALPGRASSRHIPSPVSSCLSAPVLVSAPARRQGLGPSTDSQTASHQIQSIGERLSLSPSPKQRHKHNTTGRTQQNGSYHRHPRDRGVKSESESNQARPGRKTKEDWRRSSPAWLQRRPATDLEVRFEPPLPAASSFVCCYRTASLNPPST